MALYTAELRGTDTGLTWRCDHDHGTQESANRCADAMEERVNRLGWEQATGRWHLTRRLVPSSHVAADDMPAWGAIIRNASDLPVLDVRVFFHYIAEKWEYGDWEPAMRGGPLEKVQILPPQSDRFVEIPDQVRKMIKEVSDQIYVVSIEFTDAAGNKWERDPRGALVPRS